MIAAVAVPAVYALVIGTSGSRRHFVDRVVADWPLVFLAIAGALASTLLAPRAPQRWRALLAAVLGAVAAGLALTAALANGEHDLAQLRDVVGVWLPTPVVSSAPTAGLAAVVLLLAAGVSVHGVRMPRHRSRGPTARHQASGGSGR